MAQNVSSLTSTVNSPGLAKAPKKTILVIEDEEGVRKPLALRLNKMGVAVTFARNGVAGLEEAKRHYPDLIILDLCLPKLSGEEVCKAIKEGNDERLAAIPIIMLTGKDSLAEKIVGRSIGANAYLTKPFAFYDLLIEIKRHIPLE